jgi:hypothetical protein
MAPAVIFVKVGSTLSVATLLVEESPEKSPTTAKYSPAAETETFVNDSAFVTAPAISPPLNRH